MAKSTVVAREKEILLSNLFCPHNKLVQHETLDRHTPFYASLPSTAQYALMYLYDTLGETPILH